MRYSPNLTQETCKPNNEVATWEFSQPTASVAKQASIWFSKNNGFAWPGEREDQTVLMEAPLTELEEW